MKQPFIRTAVLVCFLLQQVSSTGAVEIPLGGSADNKPQGGGIGIPYKPRPSLPINNNPKPQDNGVRTVNVPTFKPNIYFEPRGNPPGGPTAPGDNPVRVPINPGTGPVVDAGTPAVPAATPETPPKPMPPQGPAISGTSGATRGYSPDRPPARNPGFIREPYRVPRAPVPGYPNVTSQPHLASNTPAGPRALSDQIDRLGGMIRNNKPGANDPDDPFPETGGFFDDSGEDTKNPPQEGSNDSDEAFDDFDNPFDEASENDDKDPDDPRDQPDPQPNEQALAPFDCFHYLMIRNSVIETHPHLLEHNHESLDQEILRGLSGHPQGGKIFADMFEDDPDKLDKLLAECKSRTEEQHQAKASDPTDGPGETPGKNPGDETPEPQDSANNDSDPGDVPVKLGWWVPGFGEFYVPAPSTEELVDDYWNGRGEFYEYPIPGGWQELYRYPNPDQPGRFAWGNPAENEQWERLEEEWGGLDKGRRPGSIWDPRSLNLRGEDPNRYRSPASNESTKPETRSEWRNPYRPFYFE